MAELNFDEEIIDDGGDGEVINEEDFLPPQVFHADDGVDLTEEVKAYVEDVQGTVFEVMEMIATYGNRHDEDVVLVFTDANELYDLTNLILNNGHMVFFELVKEDLGNRLAILNQAIRAIIGRQ